MFIGFSVTGLAELVTVVGVGLSVLAELEQIRPLDLEADSLIMGPPDGPCLARD